jgi:dTDP-glucose pyrophosphorylase
MRMQAGIRAVLVISMLQDTPRFRQFPGREWSI